MRPIFLLLVFGAVFVNGGIMYSLAWLGDGDGVCARIDAVMLCACGVLYGNYSVLWALLCIVWCGGLGWIGVGVLVSCVIIILFVKSEM